MDSLDHNATQVIVNFNLTYHLIEFVPPFTLYLNVEDALNRRKNILTRIICKFQRLFILHLFKILIHKDYSRASED